MYLLNVLAAAGLLVSYAAPYINPDVFWIPAFFGLAYPFLLLANIFFIVYWLVQMRLKFIMSMIVILSGWKHFSNTVQWGHKATVNPGLKVMTFNVMNFGYSGNKNTRKEIVELIKEEEPDVLCLQDVYTNYAWQYDPISEIKSVMQSKGIFFSDVSDKKKIYKLGLVVVSKYPILSTGTVSFGENTNNHAIWADLNINKQKVRVYNVHMQSIRFGPREYEFLKRIGENSDSTINESKTILRRLKYAFELRGQQTELLKQEMDKSPNPVVVCGDFNDTPVSYTYRKLGDGLIDCFSESGSGMGRTYAGQFPSFRIDYILHDKSFKSGNFEVINKKLSDHFPVKAIIELQ